LKEATKVLRLSENLKNIHVIGTGSSSLGNRFEKKKNTYDVEGIVNVLCK